MSTAHRSGCAMTDQVVSLSSGAFILWLGTTGLPGSTHTRCSRAPLGPWRPGRNRRRRSTSSGTASGSSLPTGTTSSLNHWYPRPWPPSELNPARPALVDHESIADEWELSATEVSIVLRPFAATRVLTVKPG